jgi:hypothetical protein
MAFSGKNPVTSNIVLDNQILEQRSCFNFLGCDTFYVYDKNIGKRIKYLMICGTI